MAQALELHPDAVPAYHALTNQLNMGNINNANDIAPPNNNLRNTRLIEYNDHYAEFDVPPPPRFLRAFSDGGDDETNRVQYYLTGSHHELPTIGQLREHLSRIVERWDPRHGLVDWDFIISVIPLL